MAMVELATAACGRCRQICLSRTAARQRLSLAYLEQFFARMRRAGLVRSTRWPGDLSTALSGQIRLSLQGVALAVVLANRVAGRAASITAAAQPGG